MSGKINNDSHVKKKGDRHWFFLAGQILASICAVLFIITFGLAIMRTAYWQELAYSGSIKTESADACSIAAVASASQEIPKNLRNSPLKQIAIPHQKDLIVKMFPEVASSKSEYLHAYYRCIFTTKNIQGDKGVAYFHLGYIRADWSRVSINGNLQTSFSGTDKVSIALPLGSDLKKDLLVEIETFTKTKNDFGVRGLAPVVMAEGSERNASIFATSTFFTKVWPSYLLLPVLTLGIILAFGWLLGMHSRVMIPAFIYFIFTSLKHIPNINSDLISWTVDFRMAIFEAFFNGSSMAFLLFAMEIIGIHRQRLSKIAGTIVIIVSLEVLIAIIYPQSSQLIEIYHWFNRIILTAGGIYLFYCGNKLKNVSKTADIFQSSKNKANRLLLYVLIFMVAAVWVDYLFEVTLISSLRLLEYLDFLVPLFVGFILFYTVLLIERQLQEEKKERVKMETELSLAAKLQDVMVPTKLSGETHGFEYEIESKPLGILGGDWIKVHTADDRSILILGDVVGKGASAALTHSGIAAAFSTQIKLWNKGLIKVEGLLQELNQTMYELFHGEMNTTFAIVEITPNGKVSVAAGGNYWLHLTATSCKPIISVGRNMLGVKEEFSIKFQELTLNKNDWLICFTDGVIEGNRAIKRFIRAIEPEMESMTSARLKNYLKEAGAGEVLPDDASILILRYGQLAPSGITATEIPLKASDSF